ncbi:MAG: DNA polymerase [Bacteroidetes bacterium]|nr:DNA polymerase [Bacteroidota bacterium]
MTFGAPPGHDPLLYGTDETERITAIGINRNDPSATVRVYQRRPDGSVAESEDRVYPFFLIDNIERLRGCDRDRFRFQRLSGSNTYNHVVAFERWTDYDEAIRQAGRSVDGPTSPVVQISNPARMYLTQSGRTLFKGLTPGSIVRMQLDIEVVSDGHFPNADRIDDEIVVIALSDSTGWREVLHDADSEARLLARAIEVIRRRDPDVIEGHNIFRFDLPYLEARCRLRGVPLTIGRDGSEPSSFPSRTRFAERSFEYSAYEIFGRHIIDTFLLAMSFDVYKRNLPGYGLKAVARYFGVAADDRTYVDGADISRIWRSDPDRVLRYALDDVIETGAISDYLAGSSFYLTQMLPMQYQDVARTGPGIKIESLMLREYLRRRHSVPSPREVTAVTGAYTDVFLTGVAGPVVYADVASLYPSIMLNLGIRPSADSLGIFPQLLATLTELRLATKAAARDSAPDQQAELDARQASFKVLINAFYGYLGFGMALFNDSAEADRITRTGQEILRTIISLVLRAGGTVIEVDTDGVFFVPPAGVRGMEDERRLVDQIDAAMPEGIHITIDGRFEKMLSYKSKNYALLDYEGKLTFKGSSLVSRSSEQFGRRFVRAAIRHILDGRIEALHELFLATRNTIVSHDWASVESFSRTETLKVALQAYEIQVSRGERQRAAAYEAATRRRDRLGEDFRVGDRISFYIAGSGSGPMFENARSSDEWNPESPDENTAYYLRRLDEFASKFELFFSRDDFRLIFSTEDLFGFSSAGMQVRTTIRQPLQLP